MAFKETVEIKNIGSTIRIADSKTEHQVAVVETQDDKEATDGLNVVGGLRQISLTSVSKQYVGICKAEPNQKFTPYLKYFLELVRKIKNGNATDNDRCILPLGVRLCNDNNIIHIPSSRNYEEGKEFDLTERVLGEGSSSGTIRIVKDNMNGRQHALKSYHLDKGDIIRPNIGEFDEDEVLCWLEQNNSGNVPQLYMIQVINSNVLLHMEILEDVITLKHFILKCRKKLIIKRPGLLKPFSLHIFRDLLCIMNEFHNTGWTHNDLHAENVVIRIRPDTPPKLYILDFGKAKRSADIQQDMEDVAGVLQGMVMGCGEKTAIARILMTTKDREEISKLITECSSLVQESNFSNYIRQVESSLNKAKEIFNHDDRDMFREITAIISSEPGASLSDESMEMPFPSLPSPPKSPLTNSLSPQASLRMEPARDISFDTQVDSGNDSEVYSHDLEEMEVTGIKTETNTGDSLDDHQGDQIGILSNRLSNLKIGSKD